MGLISAFPLLDYSDFTLKSKPTDQYNCVAWVMGENHRAWTPSGYLDPPYPYGSYPNHFWPEGFSRDESAENFVRLFELFGFERCLSGNPEKGCEKIAIYRNKYGEFEHVAKLKPNGVWTSKMGIHDDIDHVSAECLVKDCGPIHAFMVRRKPRKTK